MICVGFSLRQGVRASRRKAKGPFESIEWDLPILRGFFPEQPMSVVVEKLLRSCLLALVATALISDPAAGDELSEAAPARAQADVNNEGEPQIALPETNKFRRVSRVRRRATNDPLVKLCQETVEVTSRRMLSTDQHTPWQMIHAILGLRNDFQLMHNGAPINGLDWIAEGQVFDNEFWFEKTRYGGRAHPYSRPYAFEGHANQTLALLSMSRVPKDREFGTATGTVTMGEMIKHAQMSVSSKDEPTWTLWALSRYLPPNARWRNKDGEMWSIERLVALQLDKLKVLRGNPCGGTHGLFALAHARNVYMATNKIKDVRRLRGVWAQANSRINEFINYTYRLRNSDGSLGHDYFRSRQQKTDFNKRMASVGHTLEFLMISLSERQLKDRWVRQAIEHAARDLMNNRKAYVKCSPLYHTVNAINIYLDRVNPKLENVAQVPDRKTVSNNDKKIAANTVSQSRKLPAETKEQDAKLAEADVKPVEVPAEKKTVEVPAVPSVEEVPAAETKSIEVKTKTTIQVAPKPDANPDDIWKATPDDERLPILVPDEKVGGAKLIKETVTNAADDIQAETESVVEPKVDIVTEPTTEEPVVSDAPLTFPTLESMELESTISAVEEAVAEKVAAATVTNTDLAIADESPLSIPMVNVSESAPVAQISSAALAALRMEYPNRPTPPESINRDYTDVNANVDQWVAEFESVDRDIAVNRKEILGALRISSGQRVADIGCGTGLFVKALSEAVGTDGSVFAVDVSPRFVDYVDQKITETELTNVTAVRCSQTDLLLNRNRLDRVLLCESYHCFEEPIEMLASIYRTLTPGGEVLLIEHERIPGVTPKEILETVRADRATFLKEFEAAGFEFVEEVGLPGVDGKYALRLRRPAF